MKKIFILVFVFFILSLVPTYADSSNLIKDGSFESSSIYDSWNQKVWDSSGITRFNMDNKVFRTGNNSLKIENLAQNDARFTQIVGVDPNSYYLLSCWAKSADVPNNNTGANISVAEITDISNDIRNSTDDWQYLELYGQTGPDQGSMTLTVGLGSYGSTNNGTVWIDDVSVKKVSSVPQGKKIVNLWNSPKNQTHSSSSSWAIMLVLLFIGIVVIIGTYILLVKFSDKLKTKEAVLTSTSIDGKGLKLTKTDYKLMGLLTFAYLVVALIYLGSFNVPTTAWKPTKYGESFVVKLDKPTKLSHISFYTGIGKAWALTSKVEVKYLNSQNEYEHFATLEKTSEDMIFNWLQVNTPQIDVSNLIFTVEDTTSEILEITMVEVNKRKPLTSFNIINTNSSVSHVDNLFDEPQTYKPYRSPLYNMYFDEIYHARTALEFLRHYTPYENTHPPLGKIFISLGIYIFGMVPFGFRIMGTLAGVIMVPVMYLFGKKLFQNSYFAFCASFLISVDFMHYAQTRIATIDSYVVLFVILMYYYMHQYFMQKSYLDYKLSTRYLLLSGLFFSLGVASKWIALYGAVGLSLIFLITKITEHIDYKKAVSLKKPPEWVKNYYKYSLGSLLTGVLGFIIIPIIIYWASYIPFMLAPDANEGLYTPIKNSFDMYDYHKNLEAEHPYQSTWWEWPVIKKPIAYFASEGTEPRTIKRIFSFGNPAIWWVGIITFFATLIISIKKRDKIVVVFLIAVLSQYIPWIGVSRIAFIYHYFSIVPFIILSIVYVLKEISYNKSIGKNLANTYLLTCLVLFIAFYPILSGIDTTQHYVQYLRWLSEWNF